MLEAEPCFGGAQAEGFSAYIRQRVFAERTEAFGDIGFVPSEAVQPTGQGDEVFVMRGCDQATRSEMDIC